MSAAIGRPFQVVAVCTANQCRSPIMEHLLQAAADARGLAWSVTSAGTAALRGAPVHPLAAEVLARRGIVVRPDWVSRRLGRSMVLDADLVLTATRDHRSQVAAMVPRAIRRTFTLAEFGILSTQVAADREEAGGRPTPAAPVDFSLTEIAAARAHAIVDLTRSLDIDDPIGLPIEDFERCAERIGDLVDQMIATTGRHRA
jgi:protein-tyrosine phosphatase